MHVESDVRSYTEKSVMIRGSLPHYATGWISLLVWCAPACVMDLFSSKTAAIWNTWVVFRVLSSGLDFSYLMWSHKGLDSWGQFHIMSRIWPLAYWMHKVKGTWGHCWALGSRSGCVSAREISHHSHKCWKSLHARQDRRKSDFPLALLLDMFPVRGAQFLCFLDWASVDWLV